MMEMRRPKFAFSEKRFLWLSTLLCAVPLGLSGLYEWNNRVPDVQLLPRVVPKPNAEDWFLKAAALCVAPKPNRKIPGGGVDLLFEEVPAKVVPVLYSADYNRIYPLARKTAFMRANSAALAAVRRGLRLPYANTLSGYTTSAFYGGRFRKLAQLLRVEAHSRAQRNDWKGAADALLDVYHLGCVMPNEAPIDGATVGYSFRTAARRDLWELEPHLSAQKLREVARKIEVARAAGPSLSKCLEWEKRSRQESLLRFTKQRDFRSFYLWFDDDCLLPTSAACIASQSQTQKKLDALDPFLQTYLKWMNKPHLMNQLTEHMDWEIAEANKPYPQRTRNWPDSIPNDNLDLLIHASHERLTLIYARGEAQDALLSTSLAIRAFRLENKRNPRVLSELVPRYLANVPLDPFSDGQPLRYKNKAKRFVASQRNEPIYASAPLPMGSPWPPLKSPPPINLPPLLSASRTIRQFEIVPFTLYSLGHNARDDGGTPYDTKTESDERNKRYGVDFTQPTSTPADIVAGINN